MRFGFKEKIKPIMLFLLTYLSLNGNMNITGAV